MTVLVAAAAPRSVDSTAAIVFIDIAIVMVVARLAGALFKRFRQPAVVGEILAGIALGPSLLGAFPGHLTTRIFPTDIQHYLSILAQIGLIIFMFIVGMEVDVALIKGKERIAGVISLSSIALPFGLGILLASAIHSSHVSKLQAPQAHRFLPFALFIGASMSITAFPVLARILTERKMYRTEIGALALACACVDDVVAWTLLAVVLAVIKSSGALSLPKIILESLAFVAFMFLVVRRLLDRVAKRYREVGLTPNLFVMILAGFLISAYITEWIGIHQIFGAFIFGVVMPRKDSAQFFHDIIERLEQLTLLLLLPLFFVVTGFSVNVRTLGSDALTQLPLILLVAIVGKLVGAFVAAKAQGIPTDKAGAVGVLMNTRGLTELIILNVGLTFGVLDQRLFTMLVVMAIVTTIMTEPLLRLVYPEKSLKRDIAEAEKAALGVIDAYRVLALIGGGGHDTEDVDSMLVDTAVDLIGDERPSQVVLSSFSQLRGGLEVGTGLAQELGQMLSGFDRLKALEQRAVLRDVPALVRSQFSDDVAADLVAQAVAVEADVVLVPLAGATGDSLAGRLLPDPALELVFVLAPDMPAPGHPTGPVAVLVGEGPNSSAALELAARVAFSRHCPLRLIPENSSRKLVRLAAERAEELTRARIDCQVQARGDGPLPEAVAESSPSLVVGGVAADGVAGGQELANGAQAALFLVRASADDDGRGLDRWLRRSDAPPA